MTSERYREGPIKRGSALVAPRLRFIETCLDELRSLARLERFDTDVVERRFVEHTLQIILQATLDVALHVARDAHLADGATDNDVFARLARGGILEPSVALALGGAVGLRNVLIRGYVDVDAGAVRRLVEHGLADFEAFIRAVRARLPLDA